MYVIIAILVLTTSYLGESADGDKGSYTVSGLGARKQAVTSAGGNALDIAIAMLETENMKSDYTYGDGKSGDAANFGIFKQNWGMIRVVDSQFKSLAASDYQKGAALNSDLKLDVSTLHAAQSYYGIDKWFGGHRNGASGLTNYNTQDIQLYKTAVYWIRDQISSNSKYLTDDTRFYYSVHPI